MALAEQSFHINRPAWTSPGAEHGVKLGRYFGDRNVAERLPGGGHALVSSTTPLRVDDGHGLAPASLKLDDDGDAYAPANAPVPIAIARHASAGVAFPDGVRITPVSAASTEAPVLAGNSVVFANAARDTDLMAEPRPTGAAISWQLRSQDSPRGESLDFHLGRGHVLRSSAKVAGAVEVLADGKPELLVSPPSAQDAEGANVPVSYSIRGNVLTTHVDLEGHVAFPVLVDPEIHTFSGFYGAFNGANVWSGWGHSSNCSCFGYQEYYNLIQTGTNPGAPLEAEGQWYVFAPGPAGEPGSAGITRVDLTGVTHRVGGQSLLYATIGESNGSQPVYSWNGYGGASGYLPLIEKGNLTGVPIAFCAQTGGGKDGSYPPLCDEELNQGRYFQFADEIAASQTEFNYVQMEGAKITYRDPAPPNKAVLNANTYRGAWLKTGPTTFRVEAEDEGLGIAKVALEAPAGTGEYFKEELGCNSGNGFNGCPGARTSATINLSELHGTGLFQLQPVATDAAGANTAPAGSRVNLYLDQTPPAISTFTGSLPEAPNGLIGNGDYTLNMSAEDGTVTAPQSGVASLEVQVDGKQQYVASNPAYGCAGQVGSEPNQACLKMSASWTMNGQTYGAGAHTVTVVARDYVGNEASRSFTVTVNEAAYEPLGPGAVNLVTGDYKLSAADVSISGGAANLSVSRTYDSRALSQAAAGPLGPAWMLGLPDGAADGTWQSLSPQANGSVAVYDVHGHLITFHAKEGGGYTSPAGYQTDAVTEPSQSPAEYRITNAQGNYTQFTQPASGAPFVPVLVAQATAAGGLNKVKTSFTKTTEGITEPTEMLAPEPSEGACSEKLVDGCRALTFTYATSTTATGEAQGEWGEVKGRLSKVWFTAWEPVKGEMSAPIAVAQYSYDHQGRLRAEWDPRITPALKTTYGYDGEGHVTAVSAPGQQPWLLHYGAISSDASTGRLLSVSRFNAETSPWKGEALKSTSARSLSPFTTPVAGDQVFVNFGSWSASWVYYTYQWERCNGLGGECSAIPGATNMSYTPVIADGGHALIAAVTATNAAGSATAATQPSKPVISQPTFTATLGSSGAGAGQFASPNATAVESNGDVWVSDAGNERIQEFSPAGVFIEAVGWGVSNGKAELETCTSNCKAGISGSGVGQFASPCALAVNQSGDVYVVDSTDDRIEEFSPTGAFIASLGSSNALANPHGIAIDTSGELWVADTGGDSVVGLSPNGLLLTKIGEAGSGAKQFNMPLGIAIAGNDLYITDAENHRVQELDRSGTFVREFNAGESGAGKFNRPSAIAISPVSGELYVSDTGLSRIVALTSEGKYLEEVGSQGSGTNQFNDPAGVAFNPTSGASYIGDANNNRVVAWTPQGPTEEPTQPAETQPTTAINTVEYQVPLSGTHAPTQMTAAEVAKWGQKDGLSVGDRR